MFTHKPSCILGLLIAHRFSVSNGNILHPLDISNVVNVTILINDALWNGEGVGKYGRVSHVVMQLLSLCFAMNRPTVCVTRWWVGRDHATLLEPTPSHANCLKPRRLPLVECTRC